MEEQHILSLGVVDEDSSFNDYIDYHGSRSKIKLSAKQQRILCTRLISTAWIRTQKSVDFERAFRDAPVTVHRSPVHRSTGGTALPVAPHYRWHRYYGGPVIR
jgi:hypothetical protein